MRRFFFYGLFLIAFVVNGEMLTAQDVIDVSEQGISNGVRDSKQQDRDEAILDAKLKAIEKAGVNIKSITESENSILKKDWIESKAEAYLLPGFQIIDVGYGDDGLYHVVLVGKVSTVATKQDKTNPAGIEWVFIKGGTFQMGDAFGDGDLDERPIQSMTISDFYLSKTEVTVAQYQVFCKATERTMPDPPSWGWRDNHPMVVVTWEDADAFCEWAGGRLPTEAEWEYASKGGNRSLGYRYSGSDNVDEVTWYDANSGNRAHSFGTKAPNELGLYDISGNVFEWCWDWYDENYYKKYYLGNPGKNPQGPSSGTSRVLRGGSWAFGAWNCRSSYRSGFKPDGMHYSLGFRCARTR